VCTTFQRPGDQGLGRDARDAPQDEHRLVLGDQHVVARTAEQVDHLGDLLVESVSVTAPSDCTFTLKETRLRVRLQHGHGALRAIVEPRRFVLSWNRKFALVPLESSVCSPTMCVPPKDDDTSDSMSSTTNLPANRPRVRRRGAVREKCDVWNETVLSRIEDVRRRDSGRVCRSRPACR